MDRSILGSRIRQRRRELSITQTNLARQVGISSSYLNLIEWNKRRVGPELARHIADVLSLDIEDLSGAPLRHLRQMLHDMAQLSLLEETKPEADRIDEFIGRFPGFARSLAALGQDIRQSRDYIKILSERLANDPYLGTNIHKMLTHISAARAAVEIIMQYPDESREQQQRFLTIIYDETRQLSSVCEALAAYFDTVDLPTRILTPLDEVESLFAADQNYFPLIEAAPSAEALNRKIETIIENSDRLKTELGRTRARKALALYAEDARKLPFKAFCEEAAAVRYDISALMQQSGSEFSVIARRLTALHEPDMPKFTWFQANAAGALIQRLGDQTLDLPRYGGACPLWVLYTAQQTPGHIVQQYVVFPDGGRFVFIACAKHNGKTGFNQPRHYITDMLALSEADAGRTIYAPDSTLMPEEVGAGCRFCPREQCLHRVEDPLTG